MGTSWSGRFAPQVAVGWMADVRGLREGSDDNSRPVTAQPRPFELWCGGSPVPDEPHGGYPHLERPGRSLADDISVSLDRN